MPVLIAAMLHSAAGAASEASPRSWKGPPVADALSADSVVAGGRASRNWLWLVVVGVLFCLPLFVGLGRTDMANDEAIYSFAVDVMVATGDWLTPRSSPREDVPFFEKPPLKFWIVAAPIRLGLLPDNEFGLRFWDAVFGGVAFLYLFAMGRRLGGPVAGIAAVLMLFVHRPLVFEHGLRDNNMEAALVLAYCGGIYHVSRWRTSGHTRPGRADLFALALYFVLGFMTKFVAALFLPMVIAVALLARRDDRVRVARWWRTWLAAAGLALVLIAPWFLYQYLRAGTAFLEDIFGAAVYTRLTTYLNPAHVQPWYFYFASLWSALVASETAVWVAAGLALVLWRILRTGWPDGVMVLLWFALPVGIISLGTSKLYHYIYPFLPPLALAAGYAAAVAWRTLMLVLGRLDRWMDGLFGHAGRRVAGAPAARWALGTIAVLGGVVAVATLALGSFRLTLGDHVLFRSSDPIRASMLVVVALLLAHRAGMARVVAVSLVLATALPVAAYRGELSALTVERHRLRSIRDCLRQVLDANGGPGGRAPLYVDGENLSHPTSFYLRTLGKWAPEVVSNEEIFLSLYAKPRPVLLSPASYHAFDRWLTDHKAARTGPGGIDAGTLAAADPVLNIPAVLLLNELLILPGPYGVCAPDASRNRRR
jgi:4-amino-4-deoxy-L-arabinose transferase-like glycosyltransferase